MKRNNVWGVWQRCSVCGTVFSDKLELREHMETHRAPPPILSTDIPGEETETVSSARASRVKSDAAREN